MEKYNYLECVIDDVKSYIESKISLSDFSNREDLEDELYNKCVVNDNITGNASGSYTFSTWEAEENLCHNLELLGEALGEFGYDSSYLEKGAESCDVIIRCYLLGQAISSVLDDIWEDKEEED